MREVLPAIAVFAVAVNPTSPTATSQLRSLQTAADKLGVQLHVLPASTEQEINTLFAAVPQLRAGGLVFTSDPYFAYRSHQLATLAVDHAVPTITQSRDFAMAGGLMSYGGDFEQSHRFTGIYTGRILKGEKPSDLPVQQVTKVALFLNLKAAGNLGITFPRPFLARVDEVID